MLFVPDPNPVYLLTWCTWLDVVSAGFASTWSIHYAHTSVTCIVTPWQSFITKRRVTVVGLVKGLWTVWSSRSVNLTTHLHVLPKLRNCGAIPLFLLYACIACSRTSLPLPLPIFCNMQHSTVTYLRDSLKVMKQRLRQKAVKVAPACFLELKFQ